MTRNLRRRSGAVSVGSGVAVRFKCCCFLPTNAHSSSISIRPTAEPNHDLVVHLGTTTADASAKAHDRVSVDAGQPLDSADAHPLGQATDYLNLLVPRKLAHDVHLPYMVVSYRMWYIYQYENIVYDMICSQAGEWAWQPNPRRAPLGRSGQSDF